MVPIRLRQLFIVGCFMLALGVLGGCSNPFAPKLQTDLAGTGTTLGDQRTLDGVFRNISYAYNYRDTLIYGNLLDAAFEFRYFNSERATDVVFNRDEEMRVTSNLFQGVDQLDLQWNDIVSQDGDSVQADITRSYTLKIVLTGSTDVFRIDGRATLGLIRLLPTDVWHIRIWRDDSSF